MENITSDSMLQNQAVNLVRGKRHNLGRSNLPETPQENTYQNLIAVLEELSAQVN